MTGRALAAVLAIAALLGSAPVGASTRVRLQAGPGVDTNPSRLEGDEAATPEALAQAVADVDASGRATRRLVLRGHYQGGARRYFEASGEDVLSQSVDGGATLHLLKGLALRADLMARDQTTRDPAVSRDASRVRGGVGIVGRIQSLTLTLSGHAERFIYKPSERLSATAPGGTLQARYAFGALSISGRGTVVARRFDGPPLELRGVFPRTGRPILVDDEAANRSDTLWAVGGSVDYTGAWVARARYSFSRNDTESYGGSFSRHEVRASAIGPLVGELIGWAEAYVQTLSYDEGVVVDELGLLDEEGRSKIAVRLLYPLTDAWSVVLYGRTWFNAFESGPSYARQMVGVDVAWVYE